jgi:hypothetical protein
MPVSNMRLVVGQTNSLDQPVVIVDQATASRITINPVDSKGNPLDIIGNRDTVEFTAREWPTDPNPYLTVQGMIDDADKSVILQFSAAQLFLPGVFYAELTFKTTSTGEVFLRVQTYLNVEKSNAIQQQYNPITIGHIRMGLLDRGAEDNFLLDDVDFSDNLICYSIEHAIETWNDLPPPEPALGYTQITFPYHTEIHDGVEGFLLQFKGRNLIRNRIPSQTTGLQFDDRARGELYLKLGMDYEERYKQTMMALKQRLNLANFMGMNKNSFFR